MRSHRRIERVLLVIGTLLLTISTYMLVTMDQRVRAVEKIENPKISDEEFSEQYQRFAELIAEIIVQIREDYVEEVDSERIFNAALEGVFDALDPHSGYLGADNFKELEKETEGEFSGIGIHINQDQYGILTVVSPIPGTPAAREGLRAWDRIVEIEGESTEALTTADAVNLLTGPVGTEVNIVIWRPSEKERIPLTIVRDRIKIESVYSNYDEADYVTGYFEYLKELGIGYIRMTKFSDNLSADVEKVLDKMILDDVHGLVLDLRFNSGGLLDEGIATSDLFLDKDQVIVGTKGRLAEQNETYRARTEAKIDWPIVILVNEATASAAEIFSGALKDHHRGVLIGPEGKNTFGKGLVQTIKPLRVSLERDEDGNNLPNAIRLTTAKYYTPDNIGEDGKSIHLIGIEPDVSVELSDEHVRELLRKGWLLGDPSSAEPGTEDEADEASEKTDDAEKSEGAREIDALLPEDGDEEPFYLRRRHEEPPEHPTTEDVQLKYAVDLMRAILVLDEDLDRE